MVKPPKTMQPEAVDLAKAGRSQGGGKSFGDDSFRNYIARKIDLQRQQFGVQLPPPPPPAESSLPPPQQQGASAQRRDKMVADEKPLSLAVAADKEREQTTREVRFAANVQLETTTIASSNSERKRPPPRHSSSVGVSKVLKRLKRRHDAVSAAASLQSQESQKDLLDLQQHQSDNPLEEGDNSARLDGLSIEDGDVSKNSPEVLPKDAAASCPDALIKSPMNNRKCPAGRPDLFFSGVVVLVNGYTQPDTETLQRWLHRHGGDLEKYETSRVTHIIAQQLSTAKANVYKRQRQPLPVCSPAWIVDCVKAQRLLPHSEYLIKEVQDERLAGMKSITSFFGDTSLKKPSGGADDGGVRSDGTDDREQADSSSTSTRRKRHATSSAEISTATTSLPSLKAASESELVDPRIHGPVSSRVHNESSSNPLEERQSLKSERGSAVAEKPGVEPPKGVTDDKFINGQVRTVGTDPNFLATFFHSSRLSFIGSFKQRTRAPVATVKGPRSSKHSKRFVFHIDMDCFFASVVLRNYPEHREKPVVISHHGKPSSNGSATSPVSKNSTSECATCNYEARKYGIKKGMYLGRAMELCPDLVVLYYDFGGYEEVSEQVADIVYKHAERFCGVVEQVSCDEAYMEIHLPVGVDHPPEQLVGELAETIRKEIFDATQCTATVGVASNKLLAKLATDRVKPNRTFVVADYRDMLRSLRLRDIHGIGYRLDQKLTTAGLSTVEQIWELGDDAERELCRILGPGTGKKILDACNGRDDRPVQPVRRKTIGAECNYGVRFDGPYGVDNMIEGLAQEVEKRMESVGVKGSKITLKLKQRKENAPPPPKFLGHGSCHNLSKSSDTPGCKVTRDWKILSHVGMSLFAQMNVPIEDIRGMGLTVSKLTTDQSGLGENQGGISKWFTTKNDADNKQPASNPCAAKDDTAAVNGEVNEVEPSTKPDPTEAFVSVATMHSPGSPRLPESASGRPNIDQTTLEVEELVSACDIEIPPLSQICMSQVAALPSPMREQVEAMIQQQRASSKKPSPETSRRALREGRRSFKNKIGTARSPEDSRMRQMDVKRMLRLAAVKSGQETLPDIQGESVSLTQLESLPLEMQLQIANGDERRIGRLSFESPDAKRKAQKRKQTGKQATRAQKSPRTSPSATDRGPSTTNTLVQEDVSLDEDERADAASMETVQTTSDSRSFFRDNVLPLSKFLDENDPADREAVEFVMDFFTVFLTDNGAADVVKLLRAIRNRRDPWAGLAFESILNHVNRHVEQEQGGAPLDRQWITGAS